MIIDKLLSFKGTVSDSAKTIDLGHEGALLMGNEYVFVINTIKAAASAGTWTLATSDDGFTTSVTLASGTIASGTAAGVQLVSMVLPFKPLKEVRLTLGTLKFDTVEAYLVPGANHVDEMKNAVAA